MIIGHILWSYEDSLKMIERGSETVFKDVQRNKNNSSYRRATRYECYSIMTDLVCDYCGRQVGIY